MQIRALVILAAAAASMPAQESFLGNLAPTIASIQKERGFPLAYRNRKGSVAEWQRLGRAEVQRGMSYSPKPVPLDLKVHSVIKRDGYEIRAVSFAGSAHYRVPALLLFRTSAAGNCRA